jgi:hypothetical protein
MKRTEDGTPVDVSAETFEAEQDVEHDGKWGGTMRQRQPTEREPIQAGR